MPLVDSSPRSPPQPSREIVGDDRYRAGDVVGGKYQLVRVLGEGGMGVVWVARNTVLDVDVAIKLIALRRGANRSQLGERLLQEARTAARVAHPAICRTYDFGETARGDPFVVSELLHGETLADLLRRVLRLPASQAAQTLLPVIDGLAVAHARGIVHRDVKSENLFLARDIADRTQPKLLDFGVARCMDGDSKLTLDGSLLGTPDYMSPEQARGDEVDFRTDVWSVCVVLYEAITGQLPFAADNYRAVLFNVINRDPKPTVASAAGDEALWCIIERGLRKLPEERWGSARELGEALALWLFERGIREDACGASLRPTWLESGLDGVRMDLGEAEELTPPSQSAPASVVRPVARSGDGSGPRASAHSWSESTGSRRLISTDHGSVRPTLAAGPSSRSSTKRWVLVALATTLVLLGVGLGVFIRGPASNANLPTPSALGRQSPNVEPESRNQPGTIVVTPAASGATSTMPSLEPSKLPNKSPRLPASEAPAAAPSAAPSSRPGTRKNRYDFGF
jgi:serine/threonine protein kinase